MKRIWENEQKVIIQTPKGVYFSNKHWALRLRNRVQTMKFSVWLKILKVREYLPSNNHTLSGNPLKFS